MADTSAATPPAQPRARQGRSPAFPYIPLQKALERAEAVRVAEGGRPKHFVPLQSVARAWGLGVKTGNFIQTVAALGHFGLFDFEGSGDTRGARLTDMALRILLDKQPVSPERNAQIQKAALTPAIHSELWQKWDGALPSEPTIETYLLRDRGFSESGAKSLIAEFKETLAFAKLEQPDSITPAGSPKGEVETPEEASIEVGDLIQIEIDGAFALEKPTRVRAIQEYEGQPFVFIDGTETGFPMEQAVLDKKGDGAAKPAAATPAAPRLPLDPAPLAQNMRREVFALDEGDVVLTFPANLSSESYADLEAYIGVFLKKAKRLAKALERPIDEVKSPDEA